METVVENMVELEEDTQKNKYLIFQLEKESYGIEIKYVTEIIGIQKITEIPELPGYIKGIINLRGKIIPVMDVRLKFGKEYTEYNDRTSIIVIEIRDTLVGLIVDVVSEVLSIEDNNIVDPPSSKTGFNNKYIKNIGKVEGEVKLILDCNRLLSNVDLDSFDNI
jgi:purine-binding chemotaxis protein CheW